MTTAFSHTICISSCRSCTHRAWSPPARRSRVSPRSRHESDARSAPVEEERSVEEAARERSSAVMEGSAGDEAAAVAALSESESESEYSEEEDYAYEDDGGDDGISRQTSADVSGLGPDTSARRWLRDGGEESLNADLEGLATHGYKGVWRVSSGSEICVAVEVPYSRFGLSRELAHSLRLEPGCVVVVKLRAQLRPASCPVLLQPASDRKLPMLRFTVLKAKPGMLSDILRQRSAQDDAAQSGHAEFGLRYSLQAMLQSFFLQMLAVENETWHAPHAYTEKYSLVYVRNCVNRGLELDSDRYMSAEAAAEKDEALKEAIAESQSGPRCAFMHTEAREIELARTNHLLRLARFVRQQLELSSQYCLVCHAPTAVKGIKPFVCASPLCLHQWQELSLGANPEVEVEQNPEVVDLMLSLFYQYAVSNEATSDDGLLPTWQNIKGWVPCSGTLRSSAADADIIEGSDTRFRAQLLKGDFIRVTPVASDGRRLAEQTRKVKVVETDSSLKLEEPFSCVLEHATFHRIRESDEALWDVGYAAANIIDGTPMRIWCSQDRPSSLPSTSVPTGQMGGMPAVSTMREWVINGDNLKCKLDQIDGRLYSLLRWVLCSMRGHLRYVEPTSGEIIPQLKQFKQFVLLCSKPETEATFQELAKQTEVRYAFHGSPVCNWHSILRNGLNFKKTSNGRAYGNGIYMATDSGVSMGYCARGHRAITSTSQNRPGAAAFARCKLVDSSFTPAAGANAGFTGWIARSMFQANFSCMAVCEVIYRPGEFVSTSPHWVIDKQEWVVTRYLCVETRDGEESKPKPPAASVARYKSLYGQGVSVPAASLEINKGPLVVAASSSAPVLDGAAGATGNMTGDPAADDEGTQINGLCQMFPQFDLSTIHNVLLSVNSDIDEAVLLLSSMAASAPHGSRGKKRSHSDNEVVDLTGTKGACEMETARATSVESTVQAAAAATTSMNEPAASLIDEVISGAAAMGLELERSGAIRLLQDHHCHVSDALAAAFG
eukprot:COSAG02_NODE_5269_length_4483_cov_9.829332_1_plen_1006_part_00